MVKHSGHILLREGVVGVAHQQTGLPHRAVPDHHTLQDPVLVAPTAAAAAVSPLSAAHVGDSSCCCWGFGSSAWSSGTGPRLQLRRPDCGWPGSPRHGPDTHQPRSSPCWKRRETHSQEEGCKRSVPFPQWLELRRSRFHRLPGTSWQSKYCSSLLRVSLCPPHPQPA